MADRKLFFALWPSHRQREYLRDMITPVLSTVEGDNVERQNWHVTLVFIGEFPEQRIGELQVAAAGIDAGEIRLRFDTLSYWQRPKIACLHAKTVPPELERLFASLQTVVNDFGIETEDRVYRPHITVARRARAFQDLRLARPIELTWTEFELMESTSGRGSVQYHPLKQ